MSISLAKLHDNDMEHHSLFQLSDSLDGMLSNGILMVCVYTREVNALSIGFKMILEDSAIERLIDNSMAFDLDRIGINKLFKVFNSFEGFSHV